jgi:DNA-binding MarR family transcriptional regulator
MADLHVPVAPRPGRTAATRWSPDAHRLRELLAALAGATGDTWRTGEPPLTAAQAQVLFHVARHPDCHVGDVAKAFRVTLPAVTHLAGRLARKGLLARATDPADRRACLLSLTPRGEALVRRLETGQLRAMERLLARLTPAARRRAVAALEALAAAADAAAVAAGNGHPPADRSNGA